MTPERFQETLNEYWAKCTAGPFQYDRRYEYPILTDDEAPAAAFDPHYLHMDLWAARLVIDDPPGRHVDVGSRVDGFVTHLLAADIPVLYVDVRPLALHDDRLDFMQSDARTLDVFETGSVRSLSCLHVAEHVGLGRYGDAIDPDGWRKVMGSLARVLAPGGDLYFAVPVGVERVCFNAHRVLSPATVLEVFAEEGILCHDFAAVDDAGWFRGCAHPVDYHDARYACGMFHLTRPA